MDNNYSLSDMAAIAGNNGIGGNAWLIILFVLLFGGGTLFGNRGEMNQYATAASQQEILFNSQFQNLGSMINKVGDGLSSLGYAQQAQMNGIQTNLGNAIVSEGRATQTGLCELKNAVHAEGEATRAMLQQNKIDALQAQVNQLQMQQALCGIPKVNSAAWGVYPYAALPCNNAV